MGPGTDSFVLLSISRTPYHMNGAHAFLTYPTFQLGLVHCVNRPGPSLNIVQTIVVLGLGRNITSNGPNPVQSSTSLIHPLQIFLTYWATILEMFQRQVLMNFVKICVWLKIIQICQKWTYLRNSVYSFRSSSLSQGNGPNPCASYVPK